MRPGKAEAPKGDHQTSSNSSPEVEANKKDAKSGGGLFKPLVALGTLPGVFRRFSQYRRLPQEGQGQPPKDKLEHELGRLTNKIVSCLCYSYLRIYLLNMAGSNDVDKKLGS